MSTQFVEGNIQTRDVLAASPSDHEPAHQRKSFQERVHEFEHEIIAEALEETGGKVTRAAKNLGLTHQGLCYIINHRHRDLLKVRTPIRIRRRSIITKGKDRGRRKQGSR
jgi:transcriptional regulator with GAF, ATPase, and Fis domain